MIKTINCYTHESDDTALAVQEILSQIDLPGSLLQNSIGILNCHYEFALSGVVQAICAQLPFDVVGVTSNGQAVNGDHGIMMLTLTVLTSDTVRFATESSGSVSALLEKPLSAAYTRAQQKLGATPKLLLTFAPIMLQYAGDQYTEILHKVSGGVPIFGTLSMDEEEVFERCYTIYNGDCQRDSVSLVLMDGDISPTFYSANVSPENTLSQTAVITSSQGNILKEISGNPCAKYLESLGLAQNGALKPGLQTLVFLVDMQNGIPPVGRVLVFLDEQGHAVCGGYVPEGSVLHVAYLTPADVLKTSQTVLDKAVALPHAQLMMIFSCNSRNVALGSDMYAEYNLIDTLNTRNLPYFMCYSGGEMCPYIHDGKVENRFMNNSFVVCIL